MVPMIMRPNSPMTLMRRLVPALALVLAATACGGAEDAASPAVATLQEPVTNELAAEELAGSGADAASETDGASTVAAEDLDPEEQMLAFAACMRAAGIADFPDPSMSPDGTLGFGGIRELGLNLQGEENRATMRGCSEQVGGVVFGGGARAGNGGDRAEVEEALLAYTGCLRDAGLDVGDIALGQPGQGANGQGANGGAAGDGAGAGQNRGQAGQAAGAQNAGPGARVANRLGLDIGDPEVEAALAACEGVLEEIGIAAGRGGR